MKLAQSDAKRLQLLLADQAVNFAAGVAGFYADLVKRANVPKSFMLEKAGSFTGDATYNARELVRWADSKGTNPGEPGWTTLGSVLRPLLVDETLGLEGIALIVALIDTYNMCLDPTERDSFRRRYGVPDLATSAPAQDVGPEIDWRGPSETVELQSWLRPKPPQFDVAFLATGLRRARSVCSIELLTRGRQGTGVLIAPRLVLTNNHVLLGEDGETDAADCASDCRLTFSGVAMSETSDPSVTFSLDAADPVPAASEALDYALLRLTSDAGTAAGLEPAPIAARRFAPRGGVNMLHHPRGASLKVSLSDAGVTGVYPDDALVQYVTRSAPGSSGAPCFDDEWQLAALHHAERSKSFGSVGEGILIDRIIAELGAYLQ